MKFRDLAPSFLYLSSFTSLAGLPDKTVQEGIDAVQGLLSRAQITNKDTFRKKVSTKSNLRSDVLYDLLAMCSLPATPFQVHEGFIDLQICDSRNEIAHGSGSAPSLELFIERRD
jgi:hypothetical protein